MSTVLQGEKINDQFAFEFDSSALSDIPIDEPFDPERMVVVLMHHQQGSIAYTKYAYEMTLMDGGCAVCVPIQRGFFPRLISCYQIIVSVPPERGKPLQRVRRLSGVCPGEFLSNQVALASGLAVGNDDAVLLYLTRQQKDNERIRNNLAVTADIPAYMITEYDKSRLSRDALHTFPFTCSNDNVLRVSTPHSLRFVFADEARTSGYVEIDIKDDAYTFEANKMLIHALVESVVVSHGAFPIESSELIRIQGWRLESVRRRYFDVRDLTPWILLQSPDDGQIHCVAFFGKDIRNQNPRIMRLIADCSLDEVVTGFTLCLPDEF